MKDDAKFWDDIADKYSKRPLPNPESTQRKIDLMRSRLHHDDHVLDIGCGTGTIALELAANAEHVHGVDISPAMIEIAKAKATSKGVKNVSFHAATLDDDLPFEPESFQLICALNILHLVPDIKDTLDKLYGLLAPGGVLVSSTACLGDSLVPYGVVISVMRFFGKAPNVVSILSTDELMAFFDGAGFAQLSRPDVGAGSTTSFIVANKPIAQRNAA